jgi:hypothetical protein
MILWIIRLLLVSKGLDFKNGNGDWGVSYGNGV